MLLLETLSYKVAVETAEILRVMLIHSSAKLLGQYITHVYYVFHSILMTGNHFLFVKEIHTNGCWICYANSFLRSVPLY